MSKKPVKPESKLDPADDAPELTAEFFERAKVEQAEFPGPVLLAEIRAKTRDFTTFEADYPSISMAAKHIGPALGLGPINTAEAILLWQSWIGHA